MSRVWGAHGLLPGGIQVRAYPVFSSLLIVVEIGTEPSRRWRLCTPTRYLDTVRSMKEQIMDPKIRARAQELRDLNSGLSMPKSFEVAEREAKEREGVPAVSREPGSDDERRGERSPIGEFLPGVVKDAEKIHAEKQREIVEKQARRREELKKTPAEVFHKERDPDELPFGKGRRAKDQPWPTHGPAKGGKKRRKKKEEATCFERWNRSKRELSWPAIAIHTQLWIWDGAPSKGDLPFFTIDSLAEFFQCDRKVVIRAIKELLQVGYIESLGYDKHHKNALYRLVPIRKVPEPTVFPKNRRRRRADPDEEVAS